MFAQFRVLYPTGSLITELLTIYNGKYVVRASVQIDGVTKATGMAVAETIESAEDQARIRALELIGLNLSWKPKETTDHPVFAPESTKGSTFPAQRWETPPMGHSNDDPSWSTHSSFESSLSEKTTPFPSNKLTAYSTKSLGDVSSSPDEKPDPLWETQKLTSVTSVTNDEDETEPTISYAKVTPIGSRRHDPEITAVSSPDFTRETSFTSPDDIAVVSLEEDLSDLIARSNVEIKRLGWTKKEGSDYLQRKYGKKTRQDLETRELADFLNYLESLPTPDK